MGNKIILLLIASRILDLITTYFATDQNLIGETSPLVRVFSFGWLEMIIFNLLLILVFYLSLYFANEKRIVKKEIRFKNYFINFKTYLSLIFFDKKISLKEFLLSNKFNLKIFLHTFVISITIGFTLLSFLVSLSNIIVMLDNTFLSSFSPYMVTQIVSFTSVILSVSVFFLYLKYRFNKIK